MEKNRESVLMYLKNNPNSKQKEIMESLEISKRTLERIIAILKEEGYIKREGSSRKGYWEILK